MPNLCTLADCQQKRDLAGVASVLKTVSALLVNSIESDCAPEVIDDTYQKFVIAKDDFVTALQSYWTHVTEERSGAPGETRTHMGPLTVTRLEDGADTGA